MSFLSQRYNFNQKKYLYYTILMVHLVMNRLTTLFIFNE